MESTIAGVTSSMAALELSKNQQDQTTALIRLSTAQKINSAAGDAVTLALSTGFRGEVATLNASSDNVRDALDYSETTSGALDGAADLIMRAEVLAIRAGNDTLGESERRAIDNELSSIEGLLNDVAAQAGPSGAPLAGSSFSVYTGNGLETLDVGAIDAGALGLEGLNARSPGTTLGALDRAMNTVLDERANVSTFAQGMAQRSEQLGRRMIDTSAALSRVADADLAHESTKLAISTVKAGASAAALVHNQQNLTSFFNHLLR